MLATGKNAITKSKHRYVSPTIQINGVDAALNQQAKAIQFICVQGYGHWISGCVVSQQYLVAGREAHID